MIRTIQYIIGYTTLKIMNNKVMNNQLYDKNVKKEINHCLNNSMDTDRNNKDKSLQNFFEMWIAGWK
jgi:GTP-sensing pleiotropic transcriptional regulator CodY